MPRLDNSHPKVLAAYDLSFDPGDPGATPPVDVCNWCVKYWDADNVETAVEHPPYSDDDYRCWDCGNELTDKDN